MVIGLVVNIKNDTQQTQLKSDKEKKTWKNWYSQPSYPRELLWWPRDIFVCFGGQEIYLCKLKRILVFNISLVV